MKRTCLFCLLSIYSYNILTLKKGVEGKKEEKEMQSPKSSSPDKDLDEKYKDVMPFEQSLQELRDLRSQLHNAADYCESTFSNAIRKKEVVDNTKDYLCMTLVTVVDHLGCVSANLESILTETKGFSDAELRIDCLKQRLLSCEQYAHKLALTKVRWSQIRPRHHPRYLSTTIREVEESNEGLRNSRSSTPTKTIEKDEFEREDIPLFLYTNSNKPALIKEESNSALVLSPVRDGLSILSKFPNSKFHFQEMRRSRRNRKSMRSSDILALIRRTKRIL